MRTSGGARLTATGAGFGIAADIGAAVTLRDPAGGTALGLTMGGADDTAGEAFAVGAVSAVEEAMGGVGGDNIGDAALGELICISAGKVGVFVDCGERR